ncbi:HU family DNA-binding protein [Bacteroides ovatus]|uniref:HU family DNA-binding protein n=1 Tax=Bacteroides ovatus TaxID=28116 RepID=UPI0039B424F1
MFKYKPMNKSELIKEVALKRKLSFNEATNAVDAIMEAIAETMHKGEGVTLVGFGSFVIQERKARNGHNPATGGSMLIPAKRQVKFRPGSKMKLE